MYFDLIKLSVKNILFAVTQVSRMFYPKADIDYPDESLKISEELKNTYPNMIRFYVYINFWLNFKHKRIFLSLQYFDHLPVKLSTLYVAIQ